MRPICLLLLLFVLWCTNASAQVTVVNKKGTVVDVDSSKWKLTDTNIYNKNSGNVGIGTNGAANSSAALEVKATDKGLLIPRVALTGTTAAAPLSAHVGGMIVYNTASAGDVIPGFYYNNGSEWKNLKQIETTQDLKDGYVDSNYNFGLGGYRNGSTAYKPLGSITSGTINMALGYNALQNNSSGSDNIAIGQNALQQNTAGIRNIAIGNNAMPVNTTGSYNTAVGRWSLGHLTEGINNSTFGSYAGYELTTGNNNTLLGMRTAWQLTTGSQNTSVGYDANYFMSTGSNNTSVGYRAGYYLSTGQANTVIGYNNTLVSAGYFTGSYNTIIGSGITGLSGSMSNNIILADGQGVQRIRVLNSGNTGIGITAPQARLHINGYAKLGTADIYADTMATAANRAGMVRYSANNRLQYHNQSQWVTLADSNTVAAADLTNDAWVNDSTTGNKMVKLGTQSDGATARPDGTEFVAKDDGNVGIGTSAPGAKLEVKGNPGLLLNFSNNTKTLFTERGTTGTLAIQNQVSGKEGTLELYSKDGDGTDYVLVGVYGAGSPADILTYRERMLFGWNAASKNYFVQTDSRGTGVLRPLRFDAHSNTVGTVQQLSLDTNGNVGINTPTPQYKLHIAGQAHADSTISAPNYTATVQTTATGSSYTWNLNLGANTAWTLAAGANTLSISNAKAGMFGLIKLTNSGTSTITLPAGSKVINGGAGVVPLTQTASAVDILTFYYDGTNYWWTYGSNYN